MRLSKDYKKYFNNGIYFVVFFAFLLPFIFLHAQTAQDLQNKISQKDSDITALEREIAIYQAELNTIGNQKNTLAGEIKKLDVTKKKLLADINVTQKKIDKTNIIIAGLVNDIGDKQESISIDLESIKNGIRKTNEFEQNSLIGVLLSEGDFTSAWNDIDNIITVRDSINEHILDLKYAKIELEGAKAVNVKAKNDLVILKTQLGDQQRIVIQNTNEKKFLIIISFSF